MVPFGSRLFCVEVQALVVRSFFPSPRRSTSGFDLNRLYLVLAVLEKRLKIPFSNQDVYLNVVGGLKISDPGADLAVAAALVSAHFEVSLPLDAVFCAEVGLTGELRQVPGSLDRIARMTALKKKLWIGAISSHMEKRFLSSAQDVHIQEFEHLSEALQSWIRSERDH